MTSGGIKHATIDILTNAENLKMWQAIENINFKPEGAILATSDSREDVQGFWIAGKVSICFTCQTEIKRMKPESLKKRRLSRLRNKLLAKAPLFFDELFMRESTLIQ
ncbi:MAG: hypothetical protein Q8M10_06760 [Methylotenera sp.]|uniref:hypothetical protein n=1 Tax=Methylotenera sp. TaxID=2051956 RepID=UPI002731CD5C|nr:hypothetical protein [Methylotenera sp.]MDP1522841.1 hypothetical protein [Methylotenera sp.]